MCANDYYSWATSRVGYLLHAMPSQAAPVVKGHARYAAIQHTHLHENASTPSIAWTMPLRSSHVSFVYVRRYSPDEGSEDVLGCEDRAAIDSIATARELGPLTIIFTCHLFSAVWHHSFLTGGPLQS